jgi:hypothetical protein
VRVHGQCLRGHGGAGCTACKVDALCILGLLKCELRRPLCGEPSLLGLECCRPGNDIRCPDLAAPKLPFAAAHWHPLTRSMRGKDLISIIR